MEEAAARTSERIGTDPGNRSMTRHGLIQPPATGAQSAAMDPRAPMVPSEVGRAASACAQRLQGCAEASLSGPSVSTASPNGGGHAIADISRKLKSP